ncbi:MAG: hypothetical protein HYX54_01400 [Chloroflexi bacterium]|nr:hypothetical protein [Chloroflexota bacterium]
MARAAAVAGDAEAAIVWRDQARASLEAIADPADRQVIEADLEAIAL